MSPCLLRSANTTNTRLKLLSEVSNHRLVVSHPYEGRPRSAKAMPSVSSPSIRRGELGVASSQSLMISAGESGWHPPLLRLPSPAYELSDCRRGRRQRVGIGASGGLLLSASQREDQVERCASGEAVVVGGLVVGPEGIAKTLVSHSCSFLSSAQYFLPPDWWSSVP